MKKILFLIVALLMVAGAAESRTLITDLGATETLADGAIDSLSAVLDPNLVWHQDADASAQDVQPQAWLFVTFTAAGTDSFSVVIDYYIDEKAGTHVVSATSFVARTSGTGFWIALAPSTPMSSIRVRLGNTDVTGSAACTNLDAVLVQILE